MGIHNLTDVTFVIHVRIDSTAREENINILVNYLQHHFNTNIMVCEETQAPRLGNLRQKLRYIWQINKEAFTHRTRCLNLMMKEATTPIVALCDTDVLLAPVQYLCARQQIIENGMDGCYPYNGQFFDIGRNHVNTVKETLSIEFLDSIQSQLGELTKVSVGGILFMNRESYLKAGLENENFKSWGYEDQERYARMGSLGLVVGRVEGPLYHMSHHRGVNSLDGHMWISNNKREFEKVRDMSREQLEEYISTWEWIQ